jgi:hypothetical protein
MLDLDQMLSVDSVSSLVALVNDGPVTVVLDVE